MASCKGKLSSFRMKELKDVLTLLGLSKQGKKQDLLDKIQALLSEEAVSTMRGSEKRNRINKEVVAEIIDDVYRKMDIIDGKATELATGGNAGLDICDQKSKDSNVKIFCLCRSSLCSEPMIQCTDPLCQVQQHAGCVIISERSAESNFTCPPNFYCEMCRIKRADPFWMTVEHVVTPMKLTVTTTPTDGMNSLQHLEAAFKLTKVDRDLLQKSEYDIQAWCVLLNDSVPFRIQWPQYADLQVNDMPVQTVSRPGSQLLGANGRDYGAKISLYITEGLNKISLSACDDRVFCFGVRLVKCCTVEEVLNLIPKETDGELFDDSLARIRRCIGGGIATTNEDSDSDLEVISDSIPVNLRCPMSGSRMKIAGRFKPCAHMGCFDLETFVQLNQRSRKWQCPICLKNYCLEEIIIDPYFNRITTMMQNCGEDITEILVKPDGSWSARTKGELSDLAKWHFPDGSLTDDGTAERHGEFQVGLNENQNRIAEAGTLQMTLFSRNQLENKLENYGKEIITMSSTVSGSRSDEDTLSINQDCSEHMVIPTNERYEINSISQDVDATYETVKNSALTRNDDIIILSDSEEENVNFENPTLDGGVSSCLGLINGNGNDAGTMHCTYPSVTEAGPGLQLLGIGSDTTDAYIDLERSSIICSELINGGTSTSKSTTLGGEQLLHSACNEIHDGLVDNPWPLYNEVPSVQHFLLSQPASMSIQSELGHQQPLNGSGTRNMPASSTNMDSTPHCGSTDAVHIYGKLYSFFEWLKLSLALLILLHYLHQRITKKLV